MKNPSSPALLAPAFSSPLPIYGAPASAQDMLRPFVPASIIEQSQRAEISAGVKPGLVDAGFDLIGGYSRYEDANLIIVSSAGLRERATRSERAGHGAAMRVALTRDDNGIEQETLDHK